MSSGSPAMWTSESMSVGMLTSSSAVAMSSSDVVNGSPAYGFRISGPSDSCRNTLPARRANVHNHNIGIRFRRAHP